MLNWKRMSAALYSPLILTVVVVTVINSLPLFSIFDVAPHDPWEAGFVVEAVRVLNSLPLYEMPEEGHATHLYGPLSTYNLSFWFSLFEPSNYLPRIVSFIAALLLVTTLAVVFVPRRGFVYWAVTVCLFYVLNNRSGNYFVSARPDMVALLFAVISLIVLYKGQLQNDLKFTLIGSLLLLIACSFKQTMMMASAIPLVSFFIDSSGWSNRKLFLSVLPFIVVFTAFFVFLPTVLPEVYHYVVWAPSQYGILVRNVVLAIWIIGMGALLFFVLLFLWIRSDDAVNPKVRWVIAALLVCVPAAVVTAGKLGATNNSLLPAFLAISAFCAMNFPLLSDMMFDNRRSVTTRIAASLLFPVLLLLYAFPVPHAMHLHVTGSKPYSEDEYISTQRLISDLSGNVICPEDPTLPLFSGAGIGRNFFLEYDAVQWPEKMPGYLSTYLMDADYVVDRGPWPWGLDLLKDEHLIQLGFEKTSDLDSENGLYSVWLKRR